MSTARANEIAPGIDLVPVTPDDANELQPFGRSIRCRPDATGGTIRITTMSDEVRNTAIAAGETLNIQVRRIHSTGTTATGLEVYV